MSTSDKAQERAVRIAWNQRHAYFIARRSLERAKRDSVDSKTIALLEEDLRHELEELQQTTDNSEDILDGAYEFWEEAQR